MYRNSKLNNLGVEDYLDDLQEELMEFEGLTNKVKNLLKPSKSGRKFKNKVVYE